MNTGVRSGVLLAVVGLWLIMRSTHGDANNRTLINHILGTNHDGSTYVPGQAGQAAASGAQTNLGAGPAAPTGAFTNPFAPITSPVAGPLTNAPPTGPRHGTGIRLLSGQAQIQGALNQIAALRQGNQG